VKLGSTGNVTHSIRSINVGANILSEWTANQRRFRGEVGRNVAIMVVAASLAIGLTYAMQGSGVRAAAAVKSESAKLGIVSRELSSLTEAQNSAAPEVAAAQLRAQTGASFHRMLGELYQVLDSAKSGMAFSSAKIDVREAQAVIDCHGDAEDYGVVAAFADQAGSTACTDSTLASTRPNHLLGPSGIAFEYIKRVPMQ
jgi:hypothetical protein